MGKRRKKKAGSDLEKPRYHMRHWELNLGAGGGGRNKRPAGLCSGSQKETGQGDALGQPPHVSGCCSCGGAGPTRDGDSMRGRAGEGLGPGLEGAPPH